MEKLRRYKSFKQLKLSTQAPDTPSEESDKRYKELEAFISFLRGESVVKKTADCEAKNGK